MNVCFGRDGGIDLGGPTADHTLQSDVGNYLLMEATGHSPQSDAILVSQPLEGNVSYCLTLYSYMPADADIGLWYHNPEDNSRVEISNFGGTGAAWDKVRLIKYFKH